MFHTYEVAGSSPAPPTNPNLERGFAFSPRGPRLGGKTGLNFYYVGFYES